MPGVTLQEAAVLLAALAIAAPLSRWLGTGNVLGYLVAGILLGPSTIGLVFSDYEAREILDFAEFGMLPAEAVRAPRFSTSHHEDSFDPQPKRESAFGSHGSLRVDKGVSSGAIDDLKARGHDVTVASGPQGHPIMVLLDRKTGVAHAAGDPAAGRHAGAAGAR